MTQHNVLLRAARERLASRLAPGEPMSRAELADTINASLWTATGVRYELDDHLVGKWERGAVQWPIAPYRAALRAVSPGGFRRRAGLPPAVPPRRGRNSG